MLCSPDANKTQFFSNLYSYLWAWCYGYTWSYFWTLLPFLNMLMLPFINKRRAGPTHCQWHHAVSSWRAGSWALFLHWACSLYDFRGNSRYFFPEMFDTDNMLQSGYHKRCMWGTISECCPGAGIRIRLGCGIPLAAQSMWHHQWCTWQFCSRTGHICCQRNSTFNLYYPYLLRVLLSEQFFPLW